MNEQQIPSPHTATELLLLLGSILVKESKTSVFHTTVGSSHLVKGMKTLNTARLQNPFVLKVYKLAEQLQMSYTQSAKVRPL
jgi:hypothetical protein